MFFGSAKNWRRPPRRWVTVPVLIRDGGSRIDGYTINLSEGGLYLFAATNLQVESEIEVEFRPPGKNKTVRIRGIVRRRALYLYGIELLRSDTAGASSHASAQSDRATNLNLQLLTDSQ
jgi:hypothetical protein